MRAARPSLSVAVTAGLGDSGHQTVRRAVLEGGRKRGHRCVALDLWPTRSQVAEHVVFGTYRAFASAGVPTMPSVLGSPAVIDALVDDLAPTIAVAVDVDVLVAAHGYDGDILARWCERTGNPAELVVLHTDFTPFPVRDHDRIDAFAGVFPAAAAAPRTRRRQWSIGLPVLASRPADLPASSDRDGILISLGARPTASVDDLLAMARAVGEQVPEARVTVCLGRPPVGTGHRVYHVSERVVAVSTDDLGDLMRRARLVVTKPGGATVAEALAHGAVPLLAASVIPWERKAVGYLVTAGVATVVGPSEGLAQAVGRVWADRDLVRRTAANGQALDIGGSTDRLWDLLEGGTAEAAAARPPVVDGAERSITDHLRAILAEAADLGDPLPRTARAIEAALAKHHRDVAPPHR